MQLKLVEKRPESLDVLSFLFEPLENFSWRAGQFLRYHLANSKPDDRGTNRFFTIAAFPDEKKVMITTRITLEKSSSFKKDLQDLLIGSLIEAQGPSGQFVVDEPSKEYVFIAGGIGITPFRSIILDLAHNNKPLNITLLYANRTEDATFKQEFEALLPTHPNFKIHYFIGDNKITDQAIKKLVPDLKKPTFYLSGPEPMIQSFEKMLLEMGVTEEHIKTDFFPGYSEI